MNRTISSCNVAGEYVNSPVGGEAMLVKIATKDNIGIEIYVDLADMDVTLVTRDSDNKRSEGKIVRFPQP